MQHPVPGRIRQLLKTPRLWHLLLLSLTLWGGEYARRDLWEPDEARYAYIAREMHQRGDYAVPHRHGEYYAHKPPLMFWLINAGAKGTGAFDGVSTRWPSLLGAVMSLWVVGRLCLYWGLTPLAWRSILFTATSALFWQKSGMGQIDALRGGLEMMAFYHLVRSEADRPKRRMALACACMGLAVLAKGPVGLIIPLGAYICATAVTDWSRLKALTPLGWGLLITAAFPAAWLLWAAAGNPPDGFLDELLYTQNVERAAGTLGHVRPGYYFITRFPYLVLPWGALLLLLPSAWKNCTAAQRQAAKKMLAWIGFVLLFFSLVKSKRELYILMAMPPSAILAALTWQRADATLKRRLMQGLFGLLAAVGILGLSGLLVDLSIQPFIPIATGGFWVTAALASVGFTGVVWANRKVPAIHGALALWTAFLLSVNTLALPSINPLKTPAPLKELADKHLPPEAPLHLYQTHGEIYTLYAHRSGRVFWGPAELYLDLREFRQALVLMESEKWDAIHTGFPPPEETGLFPMGGKIIRWLLFSGEAFQ